MSEGQRASIPWPRLAIEAFVIVGSILLAFAVDAGWDGQQERGEESDALASLRAEFTENIGRLDSTIEANETLRAGLLGMLTAIRERGVPAGSYVVPDSILTGVGGTPAFQPAHGALSSLLGSQGLVLIRDDSLRSALASWPAKMDDLAASQSQMVDVNEDHLVPILHRHVSYISVDYRSGTIDGLEAPSRFDSDFVGLLDNRELENWIDFQLLRLGRWATALEEAREDAEWIIGRIDSR